MRADKRRLAAIERSLATPWTRFRRPDGAAVLVPEMQAVDAFLRALGGRPLGLGDAVEAFLVEVEPDVAAPDAEYLVVQIARREHGASELPAPAPNEPHGRPCGPVGDPADDPEDTIGSIDDLLAEEERLVRAARSQEWLDSRYPERPDPGLDIGLERN